MKTLLYFIIALTLVASITACDKKQGDAAPKASPPAPTAGLIINGDSVKSYKASIKTIRSAIGGAKLKEFDDAISTIEFVLKDAAHLELKGKNVDEAISSRGSVENLYVDVFNLDLPQLTGKLLKLQVSALESMNAFIKDFNSYARGTKRDADDVRVGNALRTEAVEIKKRLESLIETSDITYEKFEKYQASDFSDAKKSYSDLEGEISKLENVLNEINRLHEKVKRQKSP